jgi:succinate dehydrogenase / fumarate reductase cytochrome b subunit
VNKKRPINLDLSSMTFPPMAIVSILHRISGIVLFLLMPIILYLLARSLTSEASFATTKIMMSSLHYKIALWAFFSSLVYHVIAGIRHLFMDMGFGEQLTAGRLTAVLVMVITVISTLVLGLWIW